MKFCSKEDTMNIWQGKRVRLRAVEPEDWRFFSAWSEDTETARQTYFIPFPKSEAAARKWTEEEALKKPENDQFRLVIENQDGQFVGTINTHTCEPRNGTFRYGIAILSEHWRKGYASEAIRLILRYYFDELNYQKVNVDIFDFNEPSLQLHRYLGFREEGRLRSMIYTNGKYHDSLVSGLTADEFRQAREAPADSE
jgi:RimJ/RimL family protein N-acetyltransferase